MKNLILAISLFIITTTTTAAEINFLDNPVWSTVLEKAKKEIINGIKDYDDTHPDEDDNREVEK